MKQSSSIRVLYKIMFAIRDYEGFEFAVDCKGWVEPLDLIWICTSKDFKNLIKPIKMMPWHLDQVTKMSTNGQLIGMMITKTMPIFNAI